MTDIRPRMMPQDKPLWPLEVVCDQSYGRVFVKLPGAWLEVTTADLLTKSLSEGSFTLHVGGRLISEAAGLQAVGDLQLACRHKISTAAHWVLVELPEGGHVVWDWEQVQELLRRRFEHLESQHEVLEPSSERTLP